MAVAKFLKMINRLVLAIYCFHWFYIVKEYGVTNSSILSKNIIITVWVLFIYLTLNAALTIWEMRE